MNLKQLHDYTDWLLRNGTDPELEIERDLFGRDGRDYTINVRSLFQDMGLPEMPSGESGLFGGHYISRQQLKREELLRELRRRINKGYMRSSDREGFNSKPQYVRWLGMALEGHERAARNFDCTGYFKRTDEWGLALQDEPIWAYIETNQFEYMVNLSNDDIHVRREGGTTWTLWSDGELRLPEDKRELFEVIDNFL